MVTGDVARDLKGRLAQGWPQLWIFFEHFLEFLLSLSLSLEELAIFASTYPPFLSPPLTLRSQDTLLKLQSCSSSWVGTHLPLSLA